MTTSHPVRGRAARAWVAGCAAVWILGGPAVYQATGFVCPGSPPWRMYEQDSLGVTDLELTRVDALGNEVPADRYAAFGATGRLDAPDMVRNIVDLGAAEAVARAICRFDGEAAAIRIELRVATEEGWVSEPTSVVPCRPTPTEVP